MNFNWKNGFILFLVIFGAMTGAGLLLSKLEERRLAKYMDEAAKQAAAQTVG